jgi:hypothetical protein
VRCTGLLLNKHFVIVCDTGEHLAVGYHFRLHRCSRASFHHLFSLSIAGHAYGMTFPARQTSCLFSQNIVFISHYSYASMEQPNIVILFLSLFSLHSTCPSRGPTPRSASPPFLARPPVRTYARHTPSPLLPLLPRNRHLLRQRCRRMASVPFPMQREERSRRIPICRSK